MTAQQVGDLVTVRGKPGLFQVSGFVGESLYVREWSFERGICVGVDRRLPVEEIAEHWKKQIIS